MASSLLFLGSYLPLRNLGGTVRGPWIFWYATYKKKGLSFSFIAWFLINCLALEVNRVCSDPKDQISKYFVISIQLSKKIIFVECPPWSICQRQCSQLLHLGRSHRWWIASRCGWSSLPRGWGTHKRSGTLSSWEDSSCCKIPNATFQINSSFIR